MAALITGGRQDLIGAWVGWADGSSLSVCGSSIHVVAVEVHVQHRHWVTYMIAFAPTLYWGQGEEGLGTRPVGAMHISFKLYLVYCTGTCRSSRISKKAHG
jgi:hypothetical protein